MSNNNCSVTLKEDSDKLETLRQYATVSGASKAAIISATDIVVEETLANMCFEPKCPNYGLSKSCPPNVSGPPGFRKQLNKCEQALFFKIDVPSELLFSSDKREIFQLLHELAAGIEQKAVELGFENSKGYAGGSCKSIFCEKYIECAVLSGEGKCRNLQSARQSMSGFGVNVSKLMATAGWPLKKATGGANHDTEKMSHVCGLVLIY